LPTKHQVVGLIPTRRKVLDNVYPSQAPYL
jgi:hypothetical protein